MGKFDQLEGMTREQSVRDHVDYYSSKIAEIKTRFVSEILEAKENLRLAEAELKELHGEVKTADDEKGKK